MLGSPPALGRTLVSTGLRATASTATRMSWPVASGRGALMSSATVELSIVSPGWNWMAFIVDGSLFGLDQSFKKGHWYSVVVGGAWMSSRGVVSCVRDCLISPFRSSSRSV